MLFKYLTFILIIRMSSQHVNNKRVTKMPYIITFNNLIHINEKCTFNLIKRRCFLDFAIDTSHSSI